jgi:hypothetical protein
MVPLLTPVARDPHLAIDRGAVSVAEVDLTAEVALLV